MLSRCSRRELLATFLGVPFALAGGCSRRLPLPDGRIVGTSMALGHQLRDSLVPAPAAGAWERVPVVIVGGGVAGLSAAWRFLHAGFDRFVLLELEPAVGGTSRSGGRGRIIGALVGALLMGSINNGMSLMNVPTFYQNTARGIVLLLAVAIDQISRASRSGR